ncbi:hypothetical protein MBLNU13_g08463t1 [Cladosporium sp. NU13]
MPTSSKKPKFNTLTTAGRIAKAAHEREQATAKSTPASPPSDAMPPKKKSRKIPILAPPAELEAEALRRAEAKKKPKPKPKKAPLTTKDKVTASKRKKAFVPGEDDEKGFRAGRGGEPKTKGEKPRNLMDIMRDLGQMGSAAPVSASSTFAGKVQTVASSGPRGRAKGKARERESVLMRPTERTRRIQQSRQRQGEIRAAPVACSVTIKREDGRGSSSNPQADIMNFPLELRQRIWRLAIVETQFFVYFAINQEQPDLAMTSRQIRKEVLPLYYGENTFAIEIPASVEFGMGKKKSKDPETTSLLLVRKCMAALEDSEYFGMISKWALSWAPPTRDLRVGVPGHAGNREVIVSICYPQAKSANEKAARPKIEIHRQAFCLLKSHELFQPCICMCYPAWLDDAVSAAVLAEGQNRGKQILMIAKDVEKRGGELVGSRCEDDVVELE